MDDKLVELTLVRDDLTAKLIKKREKI